MPHPGWLNPTPIASCCSDLGRTMRPTGLIKLSPTIWNRCGVIEATPPMDWLKASPNLYVSRDRGHATPSMGLLKPCPNSIRLSNAGHTDPAIGLFNAFPKVSHRNVVGNVIPSKHWLNSFMNAKACSHLGHTTSSTVITKSELPKRSRPVGPRDRFVEAALCGQLE